jgi:hypothetical protein
MAYQTTRPAGTDELGDWGSAAAPADAPSCGNADEKPATMLQKTGFILFFLAHLGLFAFAVHESSGMPGASQNAPVYANQARLFAPWK